MDNFVSYLLYWIILFLILSTWTSKSNMYTMFRGDRLNLCISISSFGTVAIPNGKQILYSFAQQGNQKNPYPLSFFDEVLNIVIGYEAYSF